MKITNKQKESLIDEIYKKLSEKDDEKGFPVLAATIDKKNNKNIVIQNKKVINNPITKECTKGDVENKKVQNKPETDINNHAEIILLKEIQENKIEIDFILITLPPCFNCWEKIKEYIQDKNIKIFFLTDVRGKKKERKYLKENDYITYWKWTELNKNTDFVLKTNFIIMSCIFGFMNHKKPAKNPVKILKFAKQELKNFKIVIDNLKIKQSEISDDQLQSMVDKTIKIKIKNITIKNAKKDREFYWIT